MTTIKGLSWPDNVGNRWQHALAHVRQSLEVSIMRCQKQGRQRTAVQAGGNVGLWPRRMADVFARVITFEPDAMSRECLIANVPSWVTVRPEALGEIKGWCGLTHKDLGSHKVTDGSTVPMTTVDALNLHDLDLLQLDVEGSEGPALRGAEQTLAQCHPLLHLELRDINRTPGNTTADIVAWLLARGYRQVAKAPGSDAIFEVAR